ncbi:MAG: hypothetical protein M8860_06250 [marine benthic group bacterium]|nr:hypothetical protein [Candidatus Carthagonibacter metallireducens]
MSFEHLLCRQSFRRAPGCEFGLQSGRTTSGRDPDHGYPQYRQGDEYFGKYTPRLTDAPGVFDRAP